MVFKIIIKAKAVVRYKNTISMLKGLLVSVVVLSGCGLRGSDPSRSSVDPRPVGPAHSAQSAIKGFSIVVSRLTHLVERTCRRRAPQMNCQFVILLDTRLNQPPNAFQPLEKNDQPVIVFTLAMLATVQNDDELAFVLDHESAHHIQGHLQQKRQNAFAGALILGGLSTLVGAAPDAIRDAQDYGMILGQRSYSKTYELQADALGTLIAPNARYDPLRGLVFFTRIADPGDVFLGTHPPNRRWIKIVREAAAHL